MKTRLAVAVLLAMCAPSLAAQRPTVAVVADSSMRMAVVTYLSGQSVYVGAGRTDGVREGTTMQVVRGGSVIATLRAVFLSSRSTSCEIVSSTSSPVVGDSVRFRPAFADAVTAQADSATSATPARSKASAWRRPIRGHVGVRYSRIDRPGTGGGATPQPSADVHLEATRVGGSPVGFVIDTRSRRVVGANGATGGASNRILVYEGSMHVEPPISGTRVALGRQYAQALSSVSLFDGALVQVSRPSWGVGAFGGVQPDPALVEFSTKVREAGAYVQFHNRPTSGRSWAFTTGAVDSRELGELNREFAFLQFSASGPKVTIYALQEVDFNRGWKREAGESAVSPTSSFATVHVRPADWFSLSGGLDNRRNVRLYRDYVSPETEFDDAFRQGVWGGVGVSGFKLRASADVRTSRGGVAGAADYYTGSFAMDPVTRLRLEARWRTTRFETDRTLGWLHTWSASTSPRGVVKVEINGGLRAQRLAADATTTTSLVPTVLADSRWIGFSLDMSVARSWYALLSGTRDGAGADRTNQLYASLLYRF